MPWKVLRSRQRDTRPCSSRFHLQNSATRGSRYSCLRAATSRLDPLQAAILKTHDSVLRRRKISFAYFGSWFRVKSYNSLCFTAVERFARFWLGVVCSKGGDGQIQREKFCKKENKWKEKDEKDKKKKGLRPRKLVSNVFGAIFEKSISWTSVKEWERMRDETIVSVTRERERERARESDERASVIWKKKIRRGSENSKLKFLSLRLLAWTSTGSL